MLNIVTLMEGVMEARKCREHVRACLRSESLKDFETHRHPLFKRATKNVTLAEESLRKYKGPG